MERHYSGSGIEILHRKGRPMRSDFVRPDFDTITVESSIAAKTYKTDGTSLFVTNN